MTAAQRHLLMTFNSMLPFPIGINTVITKDAPMTPAQETLLITLARAFRTLLVDRATREQTDPKQDANLVLLNDALAEFDRRDFATLTVPDIRSCLAMIDPKPGEVE